MNLRTFFRRKLLLTLLAAGLLSASPIQPAAAFELLVQNGSTEKAAIAIVYYEDATGKWVALGWGAVPPQDSCVYQINDSTQGKNLYIYGQSERGRLDGQYLNDSYKCDIIDDPFKYYCETEKCPNGPNKHLAYFARLPIKDGKAAWFYFDNN